MKKLLFALKMIFIASLLAWLVLKFDVKAAREALASANLAWGLLAFTVSFAGNYLYALRWTLIAKVLWPGLALSSLHFYRFSLLGTFCTLFIPTTISGEVVKVMKLGAHVNKDYARSTVTIVMDRLIGLSIWVLIFMMSPLPFAYRHKWLFWAIVAAVVIGGFLLLKRKLLDIKKKYFHAFSDSPATILRAALASGLLYCDEFRRIQMLRYRHQPAAVHRPYRPLDPCQFRAGFMARHRDEGGDLPRDTSPLLSCYFRTGGTGDHFPRIHELFLRDHWRDH